MSADGEIEIQVTAEGADEAADDLAESSEADVGDGGGGDGAIAGRLGSLGRILGVIAGLVAALGPMLEFIKALTEIASAFLAPLAIMLMRLFMPVLRGLVRLLPIWFRVFDVIEPLLKSIVTALSPLLLLMSVSDALGNLPDRIWAFFAPKVNRLVTFVSSLAGDMVAELFAGASWLVKSLQSIAEAIGRGVWSFVSQLPELIGREIAERLPSVPTRDDVIEEGRSRVEGVFDSAARRGTNVNISGGLETFVDRIETDPNIDLP